MTQPFTATTTGIDTAATIPPGARLVATGWHVALFYGPGPAFPTEAAALEAALAEVADYRKKHGRPEFSPQVTIDLRWEMEWEQGTPDANDRPTYSAGMGFTVRRKVYATAEDAAVHLANIREVHDLFPTAPVTVP